MSEQPVKSTAVTTVIAPSGGIVPAPTSITAFLGRTVEGPSDAPYAVSSFAEFQSRFGALARDYPLTYAVQDFFDNGGSAALICRLAPGAQTLTPADYLGNPDLQTGLHMLDNTGLFNLMCIPPDTLDGDIDPSVLAAAATYCASRQAMLIVDPPSAWADQAAQGNWAALDPATLVAGEEARAAAVYFPRIIKGDPLDNNAPAEFAPCGAIAGVIATNDVERGVWTAPAGLQCQLTGVSGLASATSDNANAILAATGINCLRVFPTSGPVVWGARTMRGGDIWSDDYKYLSVYRLAAFIQQSIVAGTQWTRLESNDPRLWAALQSSSNAFMTELLNQGAFYAYNVQCDATTTSAEDIANGVVNIELLFAPIRPAEFLVLSITLSAQVPE